MDPALATGVAAFVAAVLADYPKIARNVRRSVSYVRSFVSGLDRTRRALCGVLALIVIGTAVMAFRPKVDPRFDTRLEHPDRILARLSRQPDRPLTGNEFWSLCRAEGQYFEDDPRYARQREQCVGEPGSPPPAPRSR